MTLLIKCWKCGFIVEAETDVCPECGGQMDNHPDADKSIDKKEEQ